MKTIIIRQNKKGQKFMLYGGLLFLVIGLVRFFYFQDNLLFIPMGLLYLSVYFFNLKVPYLKIKDNKIRKSWGFGKPLEVAEIIQIKYFAGDYILKTKSKTITINTQAIDPED